MVIQGLGPAHIQDIPQGQEAAHRILLRPEVGLRSHHLHAAALVQVVSSEVAHLEEADPATHQAAVAGLPEQAPAQDLPVADQEAAGADDKS